MLNVAAWAGPKGPGIKKLKAAGVNPAAFVLLEYGTQIESVIGTVFYRADGVGGTFSIVQARSTLAAVRKLASHVLNASYCFNWMV